MAAELAARLWLNHVATPQQYLDFAVHTDIPAEQWVFRPHHYLNYALTPNYSKGGVNHNSLGYRGAEFPVKKPKGTYRIAIIGGSSVYTDLVKEDGKTFPVVLQRLLNRDGRPKIQVINAGVPGYNSWETLGNLQFRVLDLEPDMVIVYQGTNDVHCRYVQPDAYRGDNSGRRQAWTAPQVDWLDQSCLLRIIRRKRGSSWQKGIEDYITAPTAKYGGDLKKGGPLQVLKENPPVYFHRNLTNVTAVCKAHNVRCVLSTWAHSPHFPDYASSSYYQQGFAENNAAVRDVAESTGTPLFDFAAVMPKDREYWGDGRHVNETGAVKKAELFAQYLYEQKLLPEPKK